MFRPRPMLRIDILLLQSDLAKIISALVRGGMFHLGPLDSIPQMPSPGSQPRDADEDRRRELEQMLTRLAEDLRIESGPHEILESEDLEGWKDWAVPLVRELTVLETRKRELLDLDERLKKFILFLEKTSKVDGKIEEIYNLKYSFLVVGELPGAILAADFAPPAGIRWEILSRQEKGSLVAFYGVKVEVDRLTQYLDQHRFRPLAMPRGMRGDLSALPRKVRAVLKAIGRNLKRLEQKRLRIAQQHGMTIFQRLHTLRIRRSLMNIYRQCGFTERVAMLGGWIPRNRLKDLERVLEEIAPGRYTVHQRPARGPGTPVQLSNPRLIRPFEKILAVYGTPSYSELEPTPLLALGFLILFGMMFGDLGHGVVFILAGLILRRFSRYRDEGCILAEMGVFAAAFGVLFGAVFGTEHLVPALWFNPMNNIPKFMGAALLAGAGLIIIGLILRIWNHLRQPDPSFFTDPLGLAGLIFYGGALGTGFLVYRGDLPVTVLFWLVLPLGAIFLHPLAGRRDQNRGFGQVGILLAEGLVEVLETILGLLANTVSFLRVAAFGLAHVGLMIAVFAIADQVRDWPLGPVWTGVVHLTGNLIVLVLEGLVVSIQTVRLEFYEIFSKFFQGGGVVYRPLDLDHLPERSR